MEKKDKENLILVVEDFLTSHQFSLLPVVFCKDNDIFPIPIVIKKFRKTEPFPYHGLKKFLRKNQINPHEIHMKKSRHEIHMKFVFQVFRAYLRIPH